MPPDLLAPTTPTIAHRTLLTLNVTRPDVQAALADPWHLHRLVVALFDVPADGPGRAHVNALHAQRPGTAQLIVQADVPTDLTRLPDPSVLAATPQTWVEPLSYPAGTRLRFRLTANPTRKVTGHDGKKRQVAWTTRTSQLEWMDWQANRHGFQVDTIRVSENRTLTSNAKPNLKIQTVAFEGDLTVIDPTRFAEATRTGIGHAKAFGCGLLLTAP